MFTLQCANKTCKCCEKNSFSFSLFRKYKSFIVWTSHYFLLCVDDESQVACRKSLVYWTSLRIYMLVFIPLLNACEKWWIKRANSLWPDNLLNAIFWKHKNIQLCIQNTSHQNHIQSVTFNNLVQKKCFKEPKKTKDTHEMGTENPDFMRVFSACLRQKEGS